jgi:hypothetical protein
MTNANKHIYTYTHIHTPKIQGPEEQSSYLPAHSKPPWTLIAALANSCVLDQVLFDSVDQMSALHNSKTPIITQCIYNCKFENPVSISSQRIAELGKEIGNRANKINETYRHDANLIRVIHSCELLLVILALVRKCIMGLDNFLQMVKPRSRA